MDGVLSAADKTALVAMVKLTQVKGMKGRIGGWKDFLEVYEKEIGNSVSDPAKRSIETLSDYLKTFTKKEDVKMFKKLLESHSNRALLENAPEGETPEQSLVRLTAAHPRFSIDYSFLTHGEGWVATEIGTAESVMVAISCEMALCKDGTEALVKVCAVDQNLQIKLDQLVNPEKPIKDYRTEITGVRAKNMRKVSCSLAEIQLYLKQILSRDTILIGHGLHTYLQALKLEHARVIDISYIFKYADETISKKPSFDNVCMFMLGHQVRKPGYRLNCLNNAFAAVKIVLDKIKRGLDGRIPLVPINPSLVPEIKMTKLLIHNLPVYASPEDLCKVIPGDYNLEIEPRSSLESCTATATFKSVEDADMSFETIPGVFEKDSSGMPQKVVTLECPGEKRCIITVRKMALDSAGQVSSKKRKRIVPDSKSLAEGIQEN